MDKEEILDIIKRYKFVISIIFLILLVCLFKIFIFSDNRSLVDSKGDGQELFVSSTAKEDLMSTTASSSIEKGYVDIKGAVKKPGMYAFSGDTRVFDIVNDAGGFTEEVDESMVNLSLKVVDQMMIIVPKIGEEIPEIVETGSDDYSSSRESESKININTATVEELKQLNGIGEKKAQVIIQHREENGSFHSIEDIKQVSGIGDKTFENIRNSITID